MLTPLTVIIGKVVRAAARFRGGGGSALPGLYAERLDPSFTRRTLEQLPYGIVIISGTNGKTTTTKMVVELLAAQGLKVFTNKTGSNFTRGVAAALVGEVNLMGRLPHDIAVLELDEAYGAKFVDTIRPHHSLLLNVMRDQLDRFGEIDATARMLGKIAEATTKTVVLNREDPRIAGLAARLSSQRILYFGLSPKTRSLFPDDDSLHAASPREHGTDQPPADVTLESIESDNHTAHFSIGDQVADLNLQLKGVYNIFNAAAAMTLVRAILAGKLDTPKLLSAISQVQPAFGRGETLDLSGQPLELVLVKNPSGFRLGLQSFKHENYATMIAINDQYADGRDMSWLWDVDFSLLQPGGVTMVSGVRAYDMALRLDYDEIKIDSVETDLRRALQSFIKQHTDQPKRIFCTYTAMLALRRELAKVTKVEAVL